jgi:hypothetical protein
MRRFVNFYSSLNIIRMIKSQRIRWKGHVASMENKMHLGFCCESHRERDHQEDVHTGGG